jgi:hypothetical protein
MQSFVSINSGLTLDYYSSFAISCLEGEKIKLSVVGTIPRVSGYFYLNIYDGFLSEKGISFS